MTNFEKYKDKISHMVNDPNHPEIPAVQNGKPESCRETACPQCDLNVPGEPCDRLFLEWAVAEYVEPTVDWSKVPIDTKILVRNHEATPWVKRHFAGYCEGRVLGWLDGATSWSSSEKIPWKFAKLAKDEEDEQ